jgi:hypothetical protein
MTSALASMDFCEQVAALFLGDAPHEDAIGTTAVEIPFYHHYRLANRTMRSTDTWSSGRMLSFS